jgi:hypothetical protein
MATDGQLNSNNNVFSPFHVHVANLAPVLTLTSSNVAASAGQSFSAASLFSATDADGDTLGYYLYDGTPAADSGHFVVNGTVVPAETVYSITAAQLAQTSFVAGAAGTSDNVYAMATDGQLNSNNNVFSPFHVNVASPSPASPNASATGNDNFAFAPGLGQKTGMDFRAPRTIIRSAPICPPITSIRFLGRV